MVWNPLAFEKYVWQDRDPSHEWPLFAIVFGDRSDASHGDGGKYICASALPRWPLSSLSSDPYKICNGQTNVHQANFQVQAYILGVRKFNFLPISHLWALPSGRKRVKTQNWILNYSKNRHLHTHSNDVGLVNYHVPEGAGEKRLIIRVLPWKFEWKSLSTLTNPETLMLDTLRGTWEKSWFTPPSHFMSTNGVWPTDLSMTNSIASTTARSPRISPL